MLLRLLEGDSTSLLRLLEGSACGSSAFFDCDFFLVVAAEARPRLTGRSQMTVMKIKKARD